jgi:hypothetical protein
VKRANLFTVTETNKIKGVKDRRNILPIEKIRERIAYDSVTGAFTYTADCAVGKAGCDAVWRCRQTDNRGTPYETTRYWELVKFDENHWYDPRRLACYFVMGEWPPKDEWVGSSRQYDYSADNLRLTPAGVIPASEPVCSRPVVAAPPRVPDRDAAPNAVPEAPKKGLFARLFGF